MPNGVGIFVVFTLAGVLAAASASAAKPGGLWARHKQRIAATKQAEAALEQVRELRPVQGLLLSRDDRALIGLGKAHARPEKLREALDSLDRLAEFAPSIDPANNAIFAAQAAHKKALLLDAPAERARAGQLVLDRYLLAAARAGQDHDPIAHPDVGRVMEILRAADVVAHEFGLPLDAAEARRLVLRAEHNQEARYGVWWGRPTPKEIPKLVEEYRTAEREFGTYPMFPETKQLYADILRRAGMSTAGLE